MKISSPPSCVGCPLHRRRFLGRTALLAAGAVGALRSAVGTAPAAEAADRPVRVRIVFALHAERQPGPDWPNVGFEFGPVMRRVTDELGRRCPGMEFVTSTATGPEQAKKILDADTARGDVDGYLVQQLNCWNQVVQTFAASGKPVLYADFQFGGSGGFLVYNAALLRGKTPNVGFVASSDIRDLAEAVRCFGRSRDGGSVGDFVDATARVRARRTPAPKPEGRDADTTRFPGTDECLGRLKTSRILVVRDQTEGDEPSVAGIPVRRIPFSELNAAWEKADKDEARAVADRWQRTAARIEGVTRETLEASAAMYLAEKAVLLENGANAITINCLGGFYGGHIHAYPCLGFHQLLNDGWIGGCEADVRSAATLVVGNVLTGGRPGYISDPVIDTAKRRIIYAHCVAANRAFGPEGPTNPFEILTHSEDRQGASVRSILPVNRLLSTLEVDGSRKEILFHPAWAVANDPDDRACRTKLCAEPIGDLEKLFAEWDRWGWHRVTFYGDLEKPIEALADALGWKVVRET